MRKFLGILFILILLNGIFANGEPRELFYNGEDSISNCDTEAATITDSLVKDTSRYNSETINIKIQHIQKENLEYWISTIKVKDISQVKTAFAGKRYSNKTEETSKMAEQNEAVFAVNGGGVQFRSKSNVIRDGKIYRPNFSPLEIREDGTLHISYGNIKAEQMIENGTVHTFDFGPELLVDGKAPSYQNDNWFTKKRAPRTAIGQKEPFEYILITVDGRSQISDGMTFIELVKVFQSLGAKWAYNLDGGGSTTLFYNGTILNNPSDGKERRVSDILYFTK